MRKGFVDFTAEDDGVAAGLRQFSEKLQQKIIRAVIRDVGGKVLRTAAYLVTPRKSTTRGGQINRPGALREGMIQSKFWRRRKGSMFNKIVAPTRRMLGIDGDAHYYYPAHLEHGHTVYRGKQGGAFHDFRRTHTNRLVIAAIESGRDNDWHKSERMGRRLASADMKRSYKLKRVPGRHYMLQAYQKHRDDLYPAMMAAIDREVAITNAMRERQTVLMGKEQTDSRVRRIQSLQRRIESRGANAPARPRRSA